MTRQLACLACAGLLLASLALAAPSTLTIQGHLANGGAPTDGDHPTIFSLYDAATGGTLRWTETDTIHVASYLYSSMLGKNVPLPSSIFSQQLWLETTVDGTTLAPRIALTSAPYSQWSQRSDTATVALNGTMTGGQWETNGTDVWRPSGKVGIGVTSPIVGLDVGGDATLNDRAITIGTETNHQNERAVIQYDGAPPRLKVWTAPNVSLSLGSGGVPDRMYMTSAGNIGIGTTSPVNKLDVRGGTTSDWFNTLGAELGNGSVYTLLDDNYLQFHGTYGYAVGDEYIEFQSGYNPTIGGQGTMARITADRDPVGYDLGQGRIKLSVRNGSIMKDVLVLDQAGVSIYGAMNVTGTKCRVVETEHYGRRKVNATESAHALFMDDGQSARLINGQCRIDLNAKFLETVTVDQEHPLIVNVTFYGPHGDGWYIQRDLSGFTVIDPSGSSAEFSWTATARQKSYENLYLDPAELQTAQK